MTRTESLAGDPKDVLLRVRKSTNGFSEWIEQRVAPFAASNHPLELANWKKELDLIRGMVDRPDQVRIALVGTTGAGKSSFLNAVLGQEVLPIGVMEPCTAFVTSVTHSNDSMYHARVEFCSREEWEKDLEAFIAALQPGDDDVDGGRTESRRVLEAARKRVEAVFGGPVDDRSSPESLRRRQLPAQVKEILRGNGLDSRDFEHQRELAAYLKGLVRGTSTVWPLVTQVGVSGPYPCLAGGLEIVDLPGLNDPNAARVEVTREFLRTSPFVWIVFSMVRGLTDDVRTILGEEKLLRLLVMSGGLGALSLIGTKADDVDVNIADQLGLSDDCTSEELVRAYREQTIERVRSQLAEMIRDLGSPAEDADTLARMVGIARGITVHATSANAYMKLKGIGKLRRDFGIQHDDETGIPGVHRHLKQIGKEAGAEYSARAAEARLNQLREEITFFFRATAQRPTTELQEARARIQQQHNALRTDVQAIQARANGELRQYRERFLEKLDPLLATSVQGVRRAIEGWQGVHWSTLRAIVQRDGVFRSPTTGHSFDFNEDLAEPLLGQLPVTWEHYFTDDLDHVTDAFVVRVAESGKNFCSQVRLVVELILKRTSEGVEDQLRWFQDKVAALAAEATSRVRAAVRERRTELAAKMPLVAKERMEPAYHASRGERGPGMKRRILEHLEPTAIQSARPIYSTIQADLVEGLKDLEAIIVGMYRTLAEAAEEQARIVAHNSNIDAGNAARDPVVTGILSSMPSA